MCNLLCTLYFNDAAQSIMPTTPHDWKKHQSISFPKPHCLDNANINVEQYNCRRLQYHNFCFYIAGNRKRAQEIEVDTSEHIDKLLAHMRSLVRPEFNLMMALSAEEKDRLKALPEEVGDIDGPMARSPPSSRGVHGVHSTARQARFVVRLTEARNGDDKDAQTGKNRKKSDVNGGNIGHSNGRVGRDQIDDNERDKFGRSRRGGSGGGGGSGSGGSRSSSNIGASDETDDAQTDMDKWKAMERQLPRLVSEVLISGHYHLPCFLHLLTRGVFCVCVVLWELRHLEINHLVITTGRTKPFHNASTSLRNSL